MKGVMLAIAPKDDEADGKDDAGEESDDLAAASDFAAAVKSGDPEAIIDAFKTMMKVC